MGDEDMRFDAFWDDAEEFERDALCRDFEEDREYYQGDCDL